MKPALVFFRAFSLGLISILSGIGVLHATTTDVLIWNNQDQLEGELIGFSNGNLVWKAALFAEPFHVDATVISHVLLQADKSAAANDAKFRLESQFGDVLFGDLVSINDSTVELDSSRFGVVQVKRAAVRELRQLAHNKVVYDGPRWLDDWRVLKVGRELSEWRTTDMGFLTTEKYSGEIFHDLPLLEQAEINLAVSWKDKPGFQIDFSAAADLMGVRSKPKLSIKSWGTDIVAVAQSSVSTASFIPLTKLSRQQTELRLRIVWDNAAGKATVYSAGSRKLADVPVKKIAKQFGVLFKNRSDNLTVEQIRLSKWNGKTYSDDRTPGQAYVRLADGQLLASSVEALASGADVLTMASGDTIKLADLAIAEFQPSAKNAFEPTRLRFADGTVLSGNLLSMDAHDLTVESSILARPVTGSYTGLTGMRFYHERTHEFDFELLSNGRRLSGNVKPAASDGSLGWASVGCESASAFPELIPYTIERRLSDSTPQVNLSAGEIIYLQDSSVLLGEVKQMGNDSLLVTTPYAGKVEIPFSKIRALEMIRGSGRASFTDPGWKFLQETEPDQRSPDHLAVSKTVSLQNQDLHHRGKLTFTCQWEEGFIGLLTIQLGDSGKHVTRCSFTRDRISARCLVNAASSVNLPSIPERRANVSIETKGSRISIWVNGILASSSDTGRPVSETGVWIQAGSARNRRALGTKGATVPRLTISRLRVGDNASRLGAGFAAAEELDMLLKLPRNKRRDAPRHVLCATNRDLLRGKLVGLDSESVQFASGYKEVTLPRSKVAAVVWLGPTDSSTDNPPESEQVASDSETEDAPAPSESQVATGQSNIATELWLRDGSVFVVDGVTMDETHLQSLHPDLPNLSIPLDQLWKVERKRRADGENAVSVANWKLTLTKEPQLITGTDQGTESPLVGQDVRDLTLRMLEADDFAVRDHGDQVIVLDFWASWCAPCVKSLPKLEAIAATFPSDKVRLIAVNQGEAPFTIQAFLAHKDLDLDVALDADGGLAKRFAVKSIPQTVVIGPQGVIQRVYLGTPTSLYANLSDAIAELMQPTD